MNQFNREDLTGFFAIGSSVIPDWCYRKGNPKKLPTQLAQVHAESSTPEGDLLSVTLTVEALYLGFDLGWETPIFSMQILTLKLFGCLIPLTVCWDILLLLWGWTVEKLQIGALCAQCTSPIKWRTMVTAIQLLQQLVPRSSWRLSRPGGALAPLSGGIFNSWQDDMEHDISVGQQEVKRQKKQLDNQGAKNTSEGQPGSTSFFLLPQQDWQEKIAMGVSQRHAMGIFLWQDWTGGSSRTTPRGRSRHLS